MPLTYSNRIYGLLTALPYSARGIVFGRLPPPGDRIAAAALDRATRLGSSYSLSSAPVSPYGNLSGNYAPESTPLVWLKNRSKCNQFVGDVLTEAGFEMPTIKLADGAEHYALAEDLPRRTDCFLRLDDLSAVQAGDVLVIDYARSGPDGGHVEVVTYASRGVFETAGAHDDGAYIKDNSKLFKSLRYNRAGGYFQAANNRVFLLRPRAPV
jgi:hypothetical protein